MPILNAGASASISLPAGQFIQVTGGAGVAQVLNMPGASPIALDGDVKIGPFDVLRTVSLGATAAIDYSVNESGQGAVAPSAASALQNFATRSGIYGPQQRAIAIGSSLTDINHVSNVLYGPLRRQDRSWLDWARYNLRDKNLTLVRSYAVGGNDLDQVYAQAQVAVVQPDADWIIGDTGAINSLCNGSPISLEAGIAKGRALVDLLAACGKRVALMNPTPVDAASASGMGTLANMQKLQAFDAAVGPYAVAKGIVWIEVGALLVDKTLAAGTAIANMMQQGSTIDGVHPAQRGARVQGAAIATAISPFLRPSLRIPSSQADKFDATNNPFSLGDNPLMQGSAVPGTGFTGSMPTGKTISRSGGATGTSSVAARSDGYGNDWTVAYAGAANGDKMFMVLVEQVSSRALPGQTVVGVAQIDITGIANVKEIAVYVQATVDGVTTTGRIWEYNTTEAPTIAEFDSSDITGGVIITPELPIPNGAALTDLRMFATVTAFAASATATVKVSRAQIYRVA